MATSNIGNDLELAQIDYQRKQALADALRLQSQQPLQGQMIGNRYVAPSITQSLNKALQGYQAGQIGNQSLEDLRGARQAYDTRGQGEMQNFMSAMRGTPASTQAPLTPNDDEGNVNPNINVQAQAPDQAKALALALQSKNPMLQTIGATLLNREFTPKEPKWEKASIHNADGSIMHGYADMNSKTPEATFRPIGGSAEKVKGAVVNGQLVNPLTATPIGAPIPKQADAVNPAADLLVPDATGKLVPNAPLIEAKKAIQKSGASNINNTVSGAAPENEYNKVVGKGLGDASLALINSAQAAPEAIRSAQAIKGAIKNGAITGTGADIRQSVQKALETAGVLGEGKAATTQELISGLAKITLAGVKTSGLGAGNGFTDKDLKFLESGISASFDSTPQNLIRVADLAERVARANHAKGSAVAKRWSNDPALKNITQDVTIDSIPTAPNPMLPTKDNAAKLPNDISALLQKYGGK